MKNILESFDFYSEPNESFPEPVVEAPVITYVLIMANVAVFIAGQFLSITTGYDATIMWGSKYNELIIGGEYWRFLTPIFLHNGIVHLLVNGYSLYAVGPEVEKMFGRLSFIAIYLVAGILGNVASFAFCPLLSVGASGAIFGLLGAMLYLGIRYRAVISRVYIINVVSMIVLNLGYGFLVPQIDNFAHMGGLVGGFLTAFSCGLGAHNGFTIKKALALLLLGVLIVLGIVVGFLNLLPTVCL